MAIIQTGAHKSTSDGSSLTKLVAIYKLHLFLIIYKAFVYFIIFLKITYTKGATKPGTAPAQLVIPRTVPT